MARDLSVELLSPIETTVAGRLGCSDRYQSGPLTRVVAGGQRLDLDAVTGESRGLGSAGADLGGRGPGGDRFVVPLESGIGVLKPEVVAGLPVDRRGLRSRGPGGEKMLGRLDRLTTTFDEGGGQFAVDGPASGPRSETGARPF